MIDQASVEGGCLRLPAVLMTATTAMIGLVPLLFATGLAARRRPLATVVIGGLLTAIVLIVGGYPVGI